MTLYKFVAILL